MKYNKKDATTIPDYYHQHQHNNRLYNFKVPGNVVSNFHLQLKQSLLTLKTKPSLCIAKESMLLCHLDNYH